MNTVASTPEHPSGTHDFQHLTRRLSEASANKPMDPFVLIDWDDPDLAIDPVDARFVLPRSAALGRTTWYQDLPPEVQARLGLTTVVQSFKYGVMFECNLSRALLDYASRLPDHRPEFRYALYEVAEEARHSMMFQEFVNRSGIEPIRQAPIYDRLDDLFFKRARHFPEGFFFAVLAGEIFIDHDNRRILKGKENVHPLLRGMLKIHVTEEARHVAWAEAFLRTHLASLNRRQRLALTVSVPLIFADIAKKTLLPTRKMISDFEIPAQTLTEAYGPNTLYREELAGVVEPVVDICKEFGLFGALGQRVWKSVGLIPGAAVQVNAITQSVLLACTLLFCLVSCADAPMDSTGANNDKSDVINTARGESCSFDWNCAEGLECTDDFRGGEFCQPAGRSQAIEKLLTEGDCPSCDLRGVSLSDYDLSGADLSSANLNKAAFNGSDFRDATLTNANFSEVSARNVDFTGADMANMERVFKSDFSGSIFEGVVMSASRVANITATGAHFGNADLTGLDLEGANLAGSTFTNANLSFVRMESTSLEGADLSGANLRHIKCELTIFSNADLSHSDLTGALLRGGFIPGSPFSGYSRPALIDGADMRGADLTDAVMPEWTYDTSTTMCDDTTTLPGAWTCVDGFLLHPR